MKWNHPFELVEQGPNYLLYECDGIQARLDLFAHMARVAIYRKDERLLPTFSVCPKDSPMPRHGRDRLSVEGLELGDIGDRLLVDDVEIHVDPTNFRLCFQKNGKTLLQDREGLSYNFQGELGKGSYHYLSREQDEHIYGLGDKTGAVNKARRIFRMETFDPMGFDANSSDPLYKQVPFFICRNSVGTYGVFYDTYSNGTMDFGAEHNNYYSHYKVMHFEEEALVYYVLFGNDEEEVLHRFMELTGKAALPPRWSFDYCGSTMAYTDAPDTEKQLRNFLALLRKYDFPCGGFYLSSGYTQIGDKRCVFHWNKDKIPDPKRLADDFKEAGIHFLPNIKPAFLTEHPLYTSIAEKGWFLHYPDGTPATFPFWGGKASYLDFTNDGAFAFWTDCVRNNLVALGYESLWNDNNEYDVHDEDVLADGFGEPIPAKRIRPLFPLLMAMASRAAISGNARVMAVTRSGPAGTERVAQTWTGDNRTSFEDFRGNHKMAMTMALSGYRFFGQDIGGFAGPRPTEELFLRWIQYGVFTPRFTLHSWNDDGSSNMPWLYENLIPDVQKLFALRHSLIPYFFSEANRAVEEYHPLIYPVFLRDKGYDEESDCFFFGSSILSCPVFDPGVTSLHIRLPQCAEGWYFGETYCVGEVDVDAPLHGLPVYFIAAGSIVPMEEGGKIIFHVYPKTEGRFRFAYYGDDSTANHVRQIAVSCSRDAVEVQGTKPGERVVLHDVYERTLVLNEEIEIKK